MRCMSAKLEETRNEMVIDHPIIIDSPAHLPPRQ
jgi:hypothetical protein